MILDLEKASQALSGLKTTQGQQSLEEMYDGLQKFRAKLGVQLNDAEFRYVMQTLFNEQVVTVPPAVAKDAPGPTLLNHGFTIRQMI
jgi:hypothetical protein